MSDTAIIATLTNDGDGRLTIDGRETAISGSSITEARAIVRDHAIALARDAQTPITLTSNEPAGTWTMLVHPTGEISDLAQPAPAPNRRSLREGMPAEPRRASFLNQTVREEPATAGWRGRANQLGMHLAPGAQELAERTDVRAISQHWPGPRTIAVVNGKGGAGKTPTTVLLAALLARNGGSGVVAWDNNPHRGTLGWRTEQGPHNSTLLDLLPHVDHLLGTSAQSAELARLTHHQVRDRYDVLRSQPMDLAEETRVTADDVDRIHQVLSKYYRLIVIDSGNDESDPIWKRMIDHTDQIVVATTTRDDHAEAGALLLEALGRRNAHSAALASRAAVVITQADRNASTAEIQRMADNFRPLAASVATIPFDPSMVDGHLYFDALRPVTQRAWITAAANVARGL